MSPTLLSRRKMLVLAARGAAIVAVSQPLVACLGERKKAGPPSACALTAALTEGPFFVDEKLNRSDIRADPLTGVLSDGALFKLAFNVTRAGTAACTPLTGAFIDVWHADSSGTYSDARGFGNSEAGAGKKFLRGYQVTDASGSAKFTTIYPGWYPGRAVHIHFKVRLYAGSTKSYEFTSQFFFDDAYTDAVQTAQPYNTRGQRKMRNGRDYIYKSLSSDEKAVLTLRPSTVDGAHSAVVDLAVQVG